MSPKQVEAFINEIVRRLKIDNNLFKTIDRATGGGPDDAIAFFADVLIDASKITYAAVDPNIDWDHYQHIASPDAEKALLLTMSKIAEKVLLHKLSEEVENK